MATGVNLGTYYVEVLPSTRGASSAIERDVGAASKRAAGAASSTLGKGVSEGVEQGASAAQTSLGGLQKTMLGVGAAFAASKFFSGATAAADESRQIAAQTEAVIRSTGGAAQVTAGQIGDYAEKLAMLSGVDDEVIQSGENVLLTFKNIRNQVGQGNDVFNQATKAALDMSVALGQDLQSSAVLVGKALNDPATGLTMLTRVGVTFTEGQKAQIKALQDAGDAMGAQKIILEELNSEFGGSAEAQATAGKKLSVMWGNMQEAIGGKLLPVMDGLASAAGFVLRVFERIPGPVRTVIGGAVVLGGVVIGAAAAWTLFGGAITGTFATLGSFVGALGAYSPVALISSAATQGLAGAFAAEAVAAEGAAVATTTAAAAGSAANVALGPLGLALGAAAAVAGLALFSRQSKASSIDARSLAKEVTETGGALNDLFLKGFAKDVAGDRDFVERSRKLGFSVEQIGKALTGTRDEYVKFKAAYRDAFESARGTDAQDVLQRGIGDEKKIVALRESFTDARDEARSLTEAQKALGVESEATGDKMAGAAENGYAAHLESLRKVADDAKSSLEGVASAARDALGIALAVPEATDKQADAQATFTDALKEARSKGFTGDFLTGTDATSRDLRGKYRDLQQANADLAGAWRESGIVGDDLKNKINALGGALANNGQVYIGKHAIDDYTGSLWNAIAAMDQAQAKIDAMNFAKLADKWNEDYLGRLKITPAQVANPTVMAGISGLLELSSSGGRASGGPVRAGELYRVNERGMEYFRPAVDGSIIPVGGAGAGGGGVQIVQNFHDARPSAAAIAREAAAHANWALVGRSGR